MSRHSTRSSRLLGVGLALCTAVFAVAGTAAVAQAAKPGDSAKPVVTATASVTDDSAQVTVAVNRGAHQIRTATCTLDDAAVACGTPSDDGKKGATYAISLTALAAGTHKFAISIRLTDGGLVSSSTSFDVAESITPQSACEGAGGRLIHTVSWWVCRWVYPDQDSMEIPPELKAAVAPACDRFEPIQPVVLGDDYDADGNPYLFVDTKCWNSTTTDVNDLCQAAGGYLNTGWNAWVCATSSSDPGFLSQMTDLCAAAGGEFSRSVWGNDVQCEGDPVA